MKAAILFTLLLTQGIYSVDANVLHDPNPFNLSSGKLHQKIAQGKKSAEFYYRRAVAKFKAGNKQGAINDLNQAIKLNPNYYDAYVARGYLRKQLGLEGAQADFDKFTNRPGAGVTNPTISPAVEQVLQDPSAADGQGQERDRVGNFKGAVESYTQAIKLAPNFGEAYYHRGLTRYKLGDKKGAVDDFTQVIDRYRQDSGDLAATNYASAYQHRGNIRFELGEQASALTDFDRAIKLNRYEAVNIKPDRAVVYFNRAVTKYKAGDLQGAIDDYSQAVSLKHDYADAYNGRAIVYYNRSLAKSPGIDSELENGRARQDYTLVISLEPNNIDAYYSRGLTYGTSQDAIEDFSRVIKLKPDRADAYYLRGFARCEPGHLKEAFADLIQAFKLNPNDAVAFGKLNSKKSSINCLDLAIKFTNYTQAIKLKPNDADAYNGLGSVQLGIGYYQQAVDNYNRAIELKPDYAEAYYGRGHAYAFIYYEERVDAETDNSNRAMNDYNRSLKLKADYLPALQGRELLEERINYVNRPSSAQLSEDDRRRRRQSIDNDQRDRQFEEDMRENDRMNREQNRQIQQQNR